MLFSSYTFIIIFLPLLIVLYYITPEKWRNYVLLASSLFFYAWGGPQHLPVMLSSIAINYSCGLLVDQCRDEPVYKRLSIIAAIILNLSLLGYYKYTDFFIYNFNAITGSSIPLKHILLPIGISFYTFQGISYVLDIGQGKGHVLKNPLKLALYISLFPQLIAGPIVRYETIENQIDRRAFDADKINGGIYRFVIGLAKKVLLANFIGEYANYCFSIGDSNLTFILAWTGALAYTLQIYYDFSGYSDMAIGLGAVFGFSFPENFRHPYISGSITEFWRRWHISLSAWFRDYVYIPLGGNRKGIARQYQNILVVWLLTGLWHGASWNFVAWGLYYALLLVIEKWLRKRFVLANKRLLRIFGHFYTFVAIMIGWVIFESSTLSEAYGFILKMFNLSYRRNIWRMQFYHIFREYGIVLAIGCLFALPVYETISKKLKIILSKRVVEVTKDLIMVVLFLLCLIRLVVSSYNPFIYFRF